MYSFLDILFSFLVDFIVIFLIFGFFFLFVYFLYKKFILPYVDITKKYSLNEKEDDNNETSL